MYSEPLVSIPKDFNRVTVLLTVHHEQSGEQPSSFGFTFSDLLETSQGAYSRRMRALSDWASLDLGWMESDDVGYILIHNIEGGVPAVQPTKEEKALTASHIIELAYESSLGDYWPIPPRLFFFCPVVRAADLRIRCQNETAQYRITVVPK